MPTHIRKKLRTTPQPIYKATEPDTVTPHRAPRITRSRAGATFPPERLRLLAAMLLAPDSYDVAAEAAELRRLADALSAVPVKARGPRKLYAVDDGHGTEYLVLDDAAARAGVTPGTLSVGMARGKGTYTKLRRDGAGNPILLRISVGFQTKSSEAESPE